MVLVAVQYNPDDSDDPDESRIYSWWQSGITLAEDGYYPDESSIHAVMILILSLKGAVTRVFTISPLRRELSLTRALKRAERNRVQHGRHLPRPIRRVTRGTKGQFSYKVWHSWNRFHFIFISLAETKKPTKEGGRSEHPERKRQRRSSENAIYLNSKTQALTETQTQALASDYR